MISVSAVPLPVYLIFKDISCNLARGTAGGAHGVVLFPALGGNIWRIETDKIINL